MHEQKAPTFWDDLYAWRAIGRAQLQASYDAAWRVDQLMAALLKAAGTPGEAGAKEQLLQATAHAAIKLRMAQSFYEVLRMRLLRQIYTDGTREDGVPSANLG